MRRVFLAGPILGAAILTAMSASAYAADPVAGQKAFAVCKACHQVGPTAKNGVGPKLNGVVGRPSGSLEDYKYSDAMKAAGLTWDEASLSEYLKNPKAKIPGNKMAFPGLKDDAKIADVIAYLSQFAADGSGGPQ